MTMKLSFDGHGINEYDFTDVSRIATFTGGIGHEERTKKYGPMFAAAPAMLAILERILYAHDTGNCGLSNGEAVLCRSYAEQARAAIAQAEEGGR
jgi:hypothetical protein